MEKHILPENVKDHTQRRNSNKSSDRKRTIRKIVEKFENLYGAFGCQTDYR